MSDDSSVERRQEEARMKELLQVAMAEDDIPQALHIEDEESRPPMKEQAKEFLEDLNDNNDGVAGENAQDLLDMKNNKSDSGISAVSIGGPEPKPPTPPSTRRGLHNQFTESISSSRDSRLTEEDAAQLYGSRRTSYNPGATDLSDGSFRVGQGDHDFTKKARARVARYDLIMGLFVAFSILGAVGLMFSLVAPVQQAVQLPSKEISGPVVGSTSTDCDEIIAKLDGSEFVNSTALDDENSPQHQAMHWICEHDPAKLDVDDSAFLTRYALAVLFYGTSGRSPSETGADQTDWVQHENWLTGAGYCSWFGITCVDEEDNLELDVNGEIFQIDLSDNFLSGRVPGELSALSDAFGFHFDSNFLYGSIPTHFGLLTKLRDLWLSDNKLTGGIPAELGNMVELRELTIAANELTGEIPETLSQATHIHYIALEDNHLKGTIPAIVFSSLTAMETFHVSNNELTGSIPEELYDMTTLSTVRLSENELSGPISEKLGQLINLVSLHLTDNHFDGEVPDVFSEMDLLTEFKLGQNEFNGVIPGTLGESLALVQLAFEGNTFTGDVPEEICALMELGSLEALTADCYTEIESSKGTLDLSNIEGAELIEAGQMGGLTNEEEDLVELDGVNCECCTECF